MQILLDSESNMFLLSGGWGGKGSFSLKPLVILSCVVIRFITILLIAKNFF